jgi:hypothetical protein
MARPPRFSRSFPVLTLALAVPLIAVMAFTTYDRYLKDAGDGWKTYRNERFGYEIRYPLTWQVDRESGGDVQSGPPTHWISFIDRTVPTSDSTEPRTMASPPLVNPARLVVWVNPQGDWCMGTLKIERQPVSVDGVPGEKAFCYLSSHEAATCSPRPLCADEAWSTMLSLTRNDTRFWILVESFPVQDARTPPMLRKVIDSFRFVD